MWHETWELLIAGLGSAIAIVIAVFAIIQAKSSETQAESAKIQTNILKEEYESAHRPWIGSSTGIGFSENVIGEKFIRLDYKNYGSLPALSIIEKMGITVEKITRETIKDEKDFTEVGDSVLLPSQEQGFTHPMSSEIEKEIFQNEKIVYYWATIDFKFMNDKQGQYGIIAKRDKEGYFEIVDEWTT